MRFEGCDLFGGVVVVDAELEVIRTADNPIFPGNESTGSDGDVGKFECLDYRLNGRLASLEKPPRGECNLPGFRKTIYKHDLYVHPAHQKWSPCTAHPGNNGLPLYNVVKI